MEKSHKCEVGGAHLKISNFYVFMDLRNIYFLSLNCLHTSIFSKKDIILSDQAIIQKKSASSS